MVKDWDRSVRPNSALYRTRSGPRHRCIGSTLCGLIHHGGARPRGRVRRIRAPVRASHPSSASVGCTVSVTSSGAGHQPAFQHHEPAAGDADRHDRQRRIDREQERAALEPPDARHRRCACPREKRSASGRPLTSLRHPLQDARSGIAPIDEQVAGPAQVPAEKREFGRATPWRRSGAGAAATRTRSGCRRCSGGSPRRRSCGRDRGARGR